MFRLWTKFFVWQFKCWHFFSRVLHAWILGIRPGRLDASIFGDDWGEFEMIKIIAYKLLQSYQLSGSPRFACHQRCLYMIILIALNDYDDDHHRHLCCLLHFPLFMIRNTISKNVQGTRGAILTTHSMEEADALCSRVGIMVKGRLKWVCYIKWFFVITQFLVVQWIPYDWLRKLAPLSQPIRSKPKPIVCRPLYFSRALRRLHRC